MVSINRERSPASFMTTGYYQRLGFLLLLLPFSRPLANELHGRNAQALVQVALQSVFVVRRLIAGLEGAAGELTEMNACVWPSESSRHSLQKTRPVSRHNTSSESSSQPAPNKADAFI